MDTLNRQPKEQTYGGNSSQRWVNGGKNDAKRTQSVSFVHVSKLITTVMASGAFVDTSSAFVNPMLGTRKDDPKARYSLLAHALEAFESESYDVFQTS